MDDRLKPRKDSGDQQTSGSSENNFIPQSGQCLNLLDKSNPEKPNVSYSDLHREILKNVEEVSPKSLKNRQKQHIKETEAVELVKYMSSLPSYLEKGKDLQEKVLNVGVLDWANLEKWQYSHRQIPCRTSRCSTSSSCSSSSSFSTEGSSFHSNRGQSHSPTRQKVRRPSLQFHLITSPPKEGPYKVDIPYGGSITKFQDVNNAQSNSTNRYGNFIRRDQPFQKNHAEFKAEHYYKKSSDDLMFYRDPARFPNKLNKDLAPCPHMNAKTKEGEFKRRVEKLQGRKLNIVEQDIPQKNNPTVLLLPRDYSQNNDSKPSDPAAMLGERQGGGSQRSFVETSKQAYRAKFNSDIPHSCPLPLKVDTDEHSQMERCFNDAQSTDTLLDVSYSVQSAPEMGHCMSRCRNLEKKMPATRSPNSISNEASKALDPKVSGVTVEKCRSSSPFSRVGFSIGNVGKSLSSKEDLAKQELNLKHISACSGRENSVVTSCQGTSSSDKPSTTGRGRSSPLRRLLDPLLKLKATNYHNVREPLQRDSILTNEAFKSYDGESGSSAGTIRSNLLRDKKNGSTNQALLQVAFKNDLPLFTFAVDKNNDILAATMKKFSVSRKSDYSCIYTIFAIKEVVKKNGRWMNHSGKSKSNDYIPNVLAQLKATGFQVTNFTRQNRMSLECGIREFVLFAVALRETDQQPSDLQPHDELAAIVVKIPKDVSRSSVANNHQNDICNKVPEFSDSELDVKNRPTVGRQGLIETTVILPSGAHSLPTNGGPSSLIQRWTSNGSCDCEGWDLGCKLGVFSNGNQFSKKSGSSKAHCDTNMFELYPQGGEQGNDPALALAPFKDEIYSVEFNSSLSPLQAFAVCIAVLDSRKSCELSESCASVEDKNYVENVIAQNDGIRASNLFGREVPARYASYPPHSPIGRA